MKFKVPLQRRAESLLSKLDANNRNRITDELRDFEVFPKTKLDITKIASEGDTFRRRLWKYRTLFKRDIYPSTLR
jgi:mRNA-degrading endonuclease RelE of RelBE toxin-antitoxin system